MPLTCKDLLTTEVRLVGTLGCMSAATGNLGCFAVVVVVVAVFEVHTFDQGKKRLYFALLVAYTVDWLQFVQDLVVWRRAAVASNFDCFRAQ